MLCFLQLEKLNCIWALSLRQIGEVILVTTKQQVEQKNLVVLQRELMEKENGL